MVCVYQQRGHFAIQGAVEVLLFSRHRISLSIVGVSDTKIVHWVAFFLCFILQVI